MVLIRGGSPWVPGMVHMISQSGDIQSQSPSWPSRCPSPPLRPTWIQNSLSPLPRHLVPLLSSPGHAPCWPHWEHALRSRDLAVPERDIDWLAPTRTQLGVRPAAWICALTGNRTDSLGAWGRAQSTEPGRQGPPAVFSPTRLPGVPSKRISLLFWHPRGSPLPPPLGHRISGSASGLG